MFVYTPPEVTRDNNLVVLIDGDVIAYQAAYGKDESLDSAVHTALEDLIDQIQDGTGAGKVIIYLTGKENFRNEVACVQQYKGNRYDAEGNRITPQPAKLPAARDYLIKERGAELQPTQEADDALAIAQTAFNAAHASGGKLRSIISTIDKDLRIVPGQHHDIGNNEVFEVPVLGTLRIVEKHTGKYSKRTGAELMRREVKGTGLRFFYAQLLMGDGTDNIPGLPKSTDAMVRLFGVRRGPCGAIAAYNVLEDAADEHELFQRVLFCYRSYWEVEQQFGEHRPKHWKTGKVLSTSGLDRLIEQARLLWMRTYPGEMWEPKPELFKPLED